MRNGSKLLALAVPPCPDLPVKKREKRDWGTVRWQRMRAQVTELGGEKALGVTIYGERGEALRRWWQNGEQYGYQVFQPEESGRYGAPKREPGRLYDYGADNDFRDWGYGGCTKLYGESWDERTVLDFVGADAEENPGAALSGYHQKLRRTKTEARHKKQEAEIREDFRGIEKPGEAFKQWCLEVPLRPYRYLFYEYSRQKEKRAICSHCGQEARYAEARENARGRCRRCGTEAEFRSLRKLRRGHGFRESEFAARIEDRGTELLVRDFKVCLIFEPLYDGMRARFLYYEQARAYLDKQSLKGARMYCKESGTYAVTVEGFHKSCWYSVGDSYISPEGLREIREELEIRTPLEELAGHRLWADPTALLKKAQRRPAAEYLIKNRLWRLANEELHREDWDDFLLPGKKAAEKLCVPAQELETLRRADVNRRTLECARALYRTEIRPKAEDLRDIQALRIEWNLDFQMMIEHSSLRKALNYIRKQMAGERDGGDVCRHWRDYVGMAERTGLNLDDRQILFPKKLRDAHEEVRKLCRALDDKERDKLIERTAQRLEQLHWAFNGLEILPARSQAELVKEGETLHHCVGRAGYGEKMARGTSAIFFIRKRKEPETPYVTLELNLSTGKVIQCYAINDTYPGDRVKAFYTRWEKEIALPGLKESIKEVKSA